MLEIVVCVGGVYMLLEGKNVILTGANRGIGKAVLKCFVENGANVWACVRKKNTAFEDVCENLSKRYRVWVKPVYFDLSDEVAMKAAVKSIKSEKQRIDILVNNAGVVPENRLFQMASFTEMQRVFDINFFATIKLTQTISKVMTRQKSGTIVNMSSIAALDGEPAQIEYVASKAAIAGATKKLASELGVFGIRVNAVAPGVTKTDMVQKMQPELLARMSEHTIMKRLAEPAEIANVILFLASDLSSYMTGQIVRVDGGLR